jgi:ABC-type Na+ efflux pump permease subunit
MAALSEEELRNNVTNKDTWLRLVFLIIFGLIFYICSLLAFAASVLQFLAKLFSGSAIRALADFGDDLATYLSQVIRYLTFASDEKPFPFAPLPSRKTGPGAGTL